MKLTIQQIVRIWNRYNNLLERDIDFPLMFDVKMSENVQYCGKVALKIREEYNADRASLADKEIELPLSPIKLEEIPDKVPAGTVQDFRPLIEDYNFEIENINLDKILNGQGRREVQEKKADSD